MTNEMLAYWLHKIENNEKFLEKLKNFFKI